MMFSARGSYFSARGSYFSTEILIMKAERSGQRRLHGTTPYIHQ